MKSYTKPKAVYIYPLQIWLTTAFVGPVILFLLTNISNHPWGIFLQFYWITAIVGFVLSLPSFLFLLMGVIIIDWRSSRVFTKKLIIALWAIVLAVAPILLLTGSTDLILQKPGVLILGSYVIPLVAAVFIFSWPHGE